MRLYGYMVIWLYGYRVIGPAPAKAGVIGPVPLVPLVPTQVGNASRERKSGTQVGNTSRERKSGTKDGYEE